MKIIFTIILIFFSFFTNNVFASDIDLTNLNPAKPCPAPYQAWECYNDPNYPYNPDWSPKNPKTEWPEKWENEDFKRIFVLKENQDIEDSKWEKFIPEFTWTYAEYLWWNPIYSYTNDRWELIFFTSSFWTCNVSLWTCKNNYFDLWVNHSDNYYILENKDYIIFVLSYPHKDSISDWLIIYSKRYNNSIYFNLTFNWISEDWETKWVSSTSDKNEKIRYVMVEWNKLIFTKSYHFWLSARNNWYFLYSLDLDKIEARDFSDNPNPYYTFFNSEYFKNLESVNYNYSDFLFSELQTKKKIIFLEKQKFDTPPLEFEFFKIEDFNLERDWVKQFSGMHLEIKPKWVAYIHNNSAIYINTWWDIEYKYYNWKNYVTEKLGWFFSRLVWEVSWINLKYDDKMWYYILSFIERNILSQKFRTLVFEKDKLFNLKSKYDYTWVYYIWKYWDSNNHVYAVNSVIDYFKQATYINYQNFWFIENRESWKYNFFYILDWFLYVSQNSINLGYYKTSSFSDSWNAWNVNEDWWYTDDNYVREKEKDKEKQEREEAEKLKKREELEWKANFFTNSIEWLKTFLNLFLITFPEDYNKNLKVPFLQPIIVDWQAKIQYRVYDTELKPIEDKLNIGLMWESSDYMKKWLSFFLSLIYISCRFWIITLNLIFFYYIFKYLNSILNLLFAWNINSNWWNIWAFAWIVWFFTVLFSFCITLVWQLTFFTPFFDFVTNLLNLIFWFIATNFFDFETFYSFTNFIWIWIFGFVLLYLWVKLLKTYWKLN